jgi:AcrR family transcriptional regulator
MQDWQPAISSLRSGPMSKPSPPAVRRSDAAKKRILSAAQEVFAEKGYEAATVRQIAERASIHASMITRYFETKDQLFALASDIPLNLPDLSTFDKSEIGERLSEQFILLWEGEEANGQLQALFRASVSKEEARLKVVRIFEDQVRVAIKRIDGIDHAEDRAGFISSFLLGIAYARYIARIPPVVELNTDKLRAGIAHTLQFIINQLPGGGTTRSSGC